jgi:hypothetical protein
MLPLRPPKPPPPRPPKPQPPPPSEHASDSYVLTRETAMVAIAKELPKRKASHGACRGLDIKHVT